MRRRTMTMTMVAVSVAVVLLGIPLGGAWIALAFRTTPNANDRARVVITVALTAVGLTAVALIAAYVVAAKASRRISAPLIFLAAEAEQLGSGQVRPRLRRSGIEEIDLVQAELVRTAERVAGRLAAERQFASDASHQLRTPLTGLSLRLEEIELMSSEEEVRAEARACIEQVDRLTGVVEDLLKVSRRIGGGTTEIGVISLGGIVHANSLRVAGDRFDEAIITYVRRNYGMLIGESTAEQIKKEVASAFPDGQSKEIEVKGRNLSEGIPRAFRISTNEIREALTAPLNHIVSAVKIALEEVPPEIGADISERGIMLTGGGAMIPGLDRLLAEETGLPTLISDEPLTCVVRGCGLALERMDELGGIFTHE